MDQYLYICTTCGLYMKCASAMLPVEHACNLSKQAIKMNVNECLAILGTIGGNENATKNLVSETREPASVVIPPPPPLPPASPAPIGSNERKSLEIAAKYALVQQELRLTLKRRAQAIEEAIEKDQKEPEMSKIRDGENMKRRGTANNQKPKKRPKRQ